MNLLVTGAAGFIGSFLAEGGLDRSMQVWAGIRASSSRQYLTDKRLHFANIDLSNREQLRDELRHHKQEHGGWDYMIHAAGATKCRCKEDFFRINYEGTKILIEELISLDMKPKKFVYISSLSIFGALRENPTFGTSTHYSPITDNDTPIPNTAYGKSKLQAERYLSELTDFPFVVLRPTGVYGPREKDYFLMAKSIRQHIDFSVGYKKQELTFIYVADLVTATFLALEKGKCGQHYLVSDGQSYEGKTFSNLLQQEMGITRVIHLKMPLWFLHAVCYLSEKIAKKTGRTTTLNSDKYKIIKQRNWTCNIEPIERELGYRAAYSLSRGVKETVAWYKKEQWI
ncbi:MAG: NAD(P)-dependent oxidoreductase [Bacteroidaceae bacterium]